MTSTQVQRTLVKSAPEIWAELSDPATLARHLDPVGEIRITRAEPEQKVEWEAACARGTVLIKSSGWGTRVTLTMSRDDATAVDEVGPPPAPNEPATASEPAAQPAVASEPHSTTEPASQPAGASEPGLAGQPDAEPEPAAAPDPTGSTEPETTLARTGAPEAETVLEATSSPEPKSIDETDGEPEHEQADAPQLAAEAPAHPLELLPRRGFLARLLARRGRATRQASSGGHSFHGMAGRSPGVGPWPTASAEWVDQFPRREPDSELAPAVAEPEPSLEDMLADRELPEEDPAAGVEEMVLGAEDPAAGVEEMVLGAEDPAVEAQARPAAQHELAPAEEASSAPAQDAAVLSAVLDRLGAAHHRPFSRA